MSCWRPSVCPSSPGCLLCTLPRQAARRQGLVGGSWGQQAGHPPAPPDSKTGLSSTDRWGGEGAPRSGRIQRFASTMGNWVRKGRERNSGKVRTRQGAPQSEAHGWGGCWGGQAGAWAQLGPGQERGAPPAAPPPCKHGADTLAPIACNDFKGNDLKAGENNKNNNKKIHFPFLSLCGRMKGRQSSPARAQGHPGCLRHCCARSGTTLPPALAQQTLLSAGHLRAP